MGLSMDNLTNSAILTTVRIGPLTPSTLENYVL